MNDLLRNDLEQLKEHTLSLAVNDIRASISLLFACAMELTYSVEDKDIHRYSASLNEKLLSAYKSDELNVPKPDMLINGGLLQLVLNTLDRAGKTEIAEEVRLSVRRIEE